MLLCYLWVHFFQGFVSQGYADAYTLRSESQKKIKFFKVDLQTQCVRSFRVFFEQR